MFASKSSFFDKNLERATSEMLLEPDWGATLALCDAIRQNDISAKLAMTSIRRRMSNDNPHIAMFTLQVLESMVKNCGTPVHEELATRETMDQLKEMAKNKGDPLKMKVLELVQVWYHAFKNQSKYKIVQETYNSLKNEGYKFPALVESDAMFESENAPDWKEGEHCSRCRSQFTMLRRKHHCRSCGNIFCNDCSSKSSIIPKYGIEKEVRVCDSCYDSINKSYKISGDTNSSNNSFSNISKFLGKKTKKPVRRSGQPDNRSSSDLPQEYLNSPLAKESQAPPSRDAKKERELELQEKEELELALALSASEAEIKNRERNRMNNQQAKSYPLHQQPAGGNLYTTLDTSEMDPELARYLNRNYWDNRQSSISAQPSAPVMQQKVSMNKQYSGDKKRASNNKAKDTKKSEIGEDNEEDRQQAEFLNALKSSIEIFVNRMRSNSQRGRSIASDSSVQTLFLTLNAMHPQLLQYIKTQEDNRTFYESLQDKLSQLRDAREALNALREEHRERRRLEEEELARQRQIQMMQKLEVMRQKKQEYLDYQRQLALQRMQEQERERQQRLEQQIQIQQMRQYQQQFPYSANMQQQQQTYGTMPPQQAYQQPYSGMTPQGGMVYNSSMPNQQQPNYSQMPANNQHQYSQQQQYNVGPGQNPSQTQQSYNQAGGQNSYYDPNMQGGVPMQTPQQSYQQQQHGGMNQQPPNNNSNYNNPPPYNSESVTSSGQLGAGGEQLISFD